MKMIVISIGIFIFIVHGYYCLEVSKAEKKFKEANKMLEEVEKQRILKELEFNSKIDLEKLGSEMKKKNMVVSEDIKFFRIEE